jgi:short-subunit dehydrogenase
MTGTETTISTPEPPRASALLMGATSSLAQAMAHALAKSNYRLILAGRDESELELLAADLQTRYLAECKLLTGDFLEPGFSPELFIDRAGDFDEAIIATGDMGNNDSTDLAAIAYIMQINYTLPAQLATVIAQRFADKKRGTLVIISSVAGDRGRQSNYAYGSAKAALSTFASGLRNRFCRQGVHVMTVKPGFIDTPMTWGMHSKLIASRRQVAAAILRAMRKKKNTVYVPHFWALIMLIIIHIPEALFKRLKL